MCLTHSPGPASQTIKPRGDCLHAAAPLLISQLRPPIQELQGRSDASFSLALSRMASIADSDKSGAVPGDPRAN